MSAAEVALLTAALAHRRRLLRRPDATSDLLLESGFFILLEDNASKLMTEN